MAELAPAEKHAISHRGRAARKLAAHLGIEVPSMSPVTAASGRITKPRAAAVSIASNSSLIALKLAAAAITGSVAILSEALHSMIDLIASVIAFVSVRRADEPADVDHPYGHEKLESLAASIEGMLILAGAGLIVYESVHRLTTGAEVEKLGVGIAVIGFSALANVGRFGLSPATGAPAPLAGACRGRRPPGDRCPDLVRRPRRLGARPDHGSRMDRLGGCDRSRDRHRLRRRPDHAPVGLGAGRRSAAGRGDGPNRGRDRRGPLGVARGGRLPQAAGPQHGRRTYIDLHVQFREGTSLERAHEIAHQLRDAIESDLGDAEVLIHTEPESSRRDPSESPQAFRAG